MESLPLYAINAYVYCPRRFYIEYVDGLILYDANMQEGRLRHERRDQRKRRKDGRVLKLRELEVASSQFALHGKVDVVEETDGQVTPVEIKHGASPAHYGRDEVCWPNDQLQVIAQHVCLQHSGFAVGTQGAIYYERDRQRIEFRITDADRVRLREVLQEMRETAKADAPPLPRSDTEACSSCSLAPICIPAEINLARSDTAAKPGGRVPPKATRVPLYVDDQSAYISVKKKHLVVNGRKGEKRIPLHDTSRIVLFGNVEITTPALHRIAGECIPVYLLSTYGRFRAVLASAPRKNVLARIAQFNAFQDDNRRLTLQRATVQAKILNQRVLLQRMVRSTDGQSGACAKAVDRLARLARQCANADPEQVLGLEGAAARAYFDRWPDLLRRTDLDWNGRQRRPPPDPVNAALSFAYTLVSTECFAAASCAGLDPYLGYFHRERYARPCLALDLMEAFRPAIADSLVKAMFNRSQLTASSFLQRKNSCMLKPPARKKFYATYEEKMQTQTKHHITGQKLPWRRIIHMDALLLAAHLRAEIEDWAPHKWK